MKLSSKELDKMLLQAEAEAAYQYKMLIYHKYYSIFVGCLISTLVLVLFLVAGGVSVLISTFLPPVIAVTVMVCIDQTKLWLQRKKYMKHRLQLEQELRQTFEEIITEEQKETEN